MSETADQTKPRQVAPPNTVAEFNCYTDEQIAEWVRPDELPGSGRNQIIVEIERPRGSGQTA